jgi:ribose-phosphate pyrophosphokinase
LIPACEGSSPSSPAKIFIKKSPIQSAIFFDRLTAIAGKFMQVQTPDFMIFTGNANPVLAAEIARHTGTTVGAANVGRFSDGEVTVEIAQNVRARDVFVIQSTCAPTNENLMELIIMVDALKRASAERVSAVIPYFGYARQDRRPRSSRVPISAKVVANMLQAVGVSRVLTMDLHADQIQGFFDIPVDNIYASPVLLGDLRQKAYPDLLVVSPDVGGVVRARALAKQLDCDMAIIDKRRPRANVSEVMHVIGDIDGRNCVIMDDMIDTAGTLGQSCRSVERTWRQERVCLLHTPHLLWSSDRTHFQRFGTRRSCGDEHHSIESSRAGLQENPPTLRGTAYG